MAAEYAVEYAEPRGFYRRVYVELQTKTVLAVMAAFAANGTRYHGRNSIAESNEKGQAMRKIGIIATLLCACALSFALVGCGGGSGSGSEGDAEAAKAAFAGTWDLVGMVQDGQETSKDDIEMLKALGLEVYLNLNDDGTSELALFGESMTGTWEASSETEGTITMEGDAVGMTIDGENLKMVDGESSLTFAKGEARSAAAASTDAASTDAADADADADAELGDTELGDSELGDSELGDSELGEDSEEESSEQA